MPHLKVSSQEGSECNLNMDACEEQPDSLNQSSVLMLDFCATPSLPMVNVLRCTGVSKTWNKETSCKLMINFDIRFMSMCLKHLTEEQSSAVS